MLTQPLDVAKIRLDNALALFDEFVRATVKHPDAATLRGLERRFAERVLIQPSYWSQIKSRSRQIGERLARQFELCCHKPGGWMDQPHVGVAAGAGFSGAGAAGPGAPAATASPADADASAPKTTTNALSSASCSPTTAAIRSAPARGCSICSARCLHRHPIPALNGARPHLAARLPLRPQRACRQARWTSKRCGDNRKPAWHR